jgi:hypothetical protein
MPWLQVQILLGPSTCAASRARKSFPVRPGGIRLYNGIA